MNLSSGNIHPVSKFDNDDVVFVVDSENKSVHIGEVLSVDLKDDDNTVTVPEIDIKWWHSDPPTSLYDPDKEAESLEDDKYKNVQLSDRILQAGDSVTQYMQPNRRGVVLSIKRKCDLEIVGRDQYIRNVDCRKLITNPRGDPPRRVLYKGWCGVADIKASSVIVRFGDGARCLVPASILNKFDPVAHESVSMHDFIVEGMTLRGDVSQFQSPQCKFLNSTSANNMLLFSILPRNVETEVRIEKVTTRGLVVDWLWHFVDSSAKKPPKILPGKEMSKVTFLDPLDDVWLWGCRFDTLWSYLVEEGDEIIDNNSDQLSREKLFYHFYVNESDGDRTVNCYTVAAAMEEEQQTEERTTQSAKITKTLNRLSSGSIKQRLHKKRRAKEVPGLETEVVRRVYLEESEGKFDLLQKVKAGERVAVSVVRSESLADVVWEDGTLERDLPMATFGFEMFEDYMQAPQLLPGDLILPPGGEQQTGPCLEQTDWKQGFGVVQTYSSSSRVCTVNWFDVSDDRRSVCPSTVDRPRELGSWGVHRLDSVAQAVDRNNNIFVWVDDEKDCRAENSENLRAGLLKDIDGSTGELEVHEFTGEGKTVRLAPSHPGIVPFANVLTESERIKLACNSTRIFDDDLDDDSSSSSDDEEDEGEANEMETTAESPADEEQNGAVVMANELVEPRDFLGWRTVKVEEETVASTEERTIDISELYEDYQDLRIGVATMFSDMSSVNPMGLTNAFMKLMDFGPVLVRMYHVTRDYRFQSIANRLKRFGATWCHEIVCNVSQPLLRRAWLPPSDRPHDQTEVFRIMTHLVAMIADAAKLVCDSVESLADRYSRDFVLPGLGDTQVVWPSVMPIPDASPQRNNPEAINGEIEVDGATADVEEEGRVTFVGEEEFRRTHHFFNEPQAATRAFIKAWKADVTLLQSSLPEGIFVKACEERMDLFAFMLIGPEDTPFEDCVFHFDVCLGADYPQKPPKVFFYSYIKERLNPNLYADGKVCLSLLGTWEGSQKERETWNPDLSNLLQIIISIQGLILNAEPFMNEPGHDKAEDKQRAHYIRLYNEEVVLLSTVFTTKLLSRPPQVFIKEIKKHFRKQGATYVRRLEEWYKSEGEMATELKPKFSLLPVTRGFQLSMPAYLSALKTQLDSILLP